MILRRMEMGRQNSVRQVVKKDFNWYGSVGTKIGVDSVEVLARVENIRTQLLENSVLRVDVAIRMFAIVPEKNGSIQNGAISKKSVTKDIDTNYFIPLRRVEQFSDIVSIHHDIKVDSVSVRMGRVSVVGTLSLEVTYLGYVILEGMVTEFSHNAAVGGALVSIKEFNGQDVLFSTTTGRDGSYLFNEITPGTYLVTVEAEGYETAEQVAVVMLHDRVNFILHRL